MQYKNATVYLVVEAKRDGDVVFEGTANEIALFVGCGAVNIRYSALKQSLVKRKYRIEFKFKDTPPITNGRLVKEYIACDTEDNDNIVIQGTIDELSEFFQVTKANIRQTWNDCYKLKGRYTIFKEE